MSVITYLSFLLVASALSRADQPISRPPAQRVIANQKYHFTVIRPDRWYAYLGAELPVFYNFGADQMLPQWHYPPGGASIQMYVAAVGTNDLAHWAASIVNRENGSNAAERSIEGPSGNGLRVAFEDLPLATTMETTSFVLVAWQARGVFFGAELKYRKGDPKAADYEPVLLDLMRSFRLK
jgi:hypothetical protein